MEFQTGNFLNRFINFSSNKEKIKRKGDNTNKVEEIDQFLLTMLVVCQACLSYSCT